MLVSCLMLAHQVASKSARDALFLSHFDASYFPLMVMVGSAISIAAGLLTSRLLQALTPARIVPWTFLASGALHLLEWHFSHSAYRDVVVILVYVHVVGLGAIVLSGFWSLLNEQFDPHSGKKHFGRIAGVGTLGGILGGLAAERFAVLLPPTAILLLLGGLHLLCGAITFLVVRRSKTAVRGEPPQKTDDDSVTPAAWNAFQKSSYLRMLAGIVLLGTTSATLLDIAFKTQSTSLIGRGPQLFRFFALFYTASQILSFLVQILVTRRWLEKLGLARGVASLPTVVAAGGIGTLVFPTFPILVATRGLEIVLRSSIYRAGYELLYTPLPVQEKRAGKPVVDVVFDRMGDLLGGGVSQILLLLGAAFAPKVILLVAVGLAGISFFITRRLQKAYVRVLEQGLVDRAVELDVATSHELITRSVLLRTLSIKKEPVQESATGQTALKPAERRPLLTDPTLQRLVELRSGNRETVRRALAGIEHPDPLVTSQLIVLLAWDEISPDVLQLLRDAVRRIAGQLVDALLGKDTDFAIRRRIPRALAYSDDAIAVQGLMRALDDERFEVRFQCARALDAILQRNPQYRPDPDKVFAIIERELSVDRAVWGSRRLLDRRQSTDQFLFLDDNLRGRAQLSWEHLFSLLALILPREPLKVAFQALHTDDRILRGLALEYLDSVLPRALRGVPGILETATIVATTNNPEELAARLLNARETVSLKLASAASSQAETDDR